MKLVICYGSRMGLYPFALQPLTRKLLLQAIKNELLLLVIINTYSNKNKNGDNVIQISMASSFTKMRLPAY